MRIVWLIFTLIVLTACSFASQHKVLNPVGSEGQSSGEQLVSALLDEAYEAYLRTSPISASMRGLREYDRLVSDLSDQAREISYQGLERRLSRAKQLLAEHSDLRETDRLSLELLVAKSSDSLNLRRFKREEQRLTQLNGLQTWLMQLTKRLPIRTEQERKDYLVRLQKIATMVDEEVALLRRGLKSGNTPPRAVLAGVDSQVKAMLNEAHLAKPLSHPLLSPSEPKVSLLRTERRQKTSSDEAWHRVSRGIKHLLSKNILVEPDKRSRLMIYPMVRLSTAH